MPVGGMGTTTRRPPPAPGSPSDLLRRRSYVAALVMGALLGVPVAMIYIKGNVVDHEYTFETQDGHRIAETSKW